MSSRLALLFAPLAVLFGAGVAPAQHHGHGGAAHAGHAHGGAYHGAYYGGGHHHHNGWAVGIGIGLGYGLGYGGYGYGGYGYGYPYYGGYPAYGGYYPYYGVDSYYGGYAVAPAVIASPAMSGYYVSPSVGGPVTNGHYSSSGNGYSPAGPASTVVPASSTTVSSSPAPATFTMNVPENAQVWFDGKETEKSVTRTYTSPALEPGKPGVLSVKMEINGSMSEMRVPLRAGDKMSMDVRR